MEIRAKISHAAAQCRVHRATIHRWIAAGLITQHSDGTVALEDVTTIRERLANTPRRIARDKARRTQINHMLASIAA
jgi:hypothetical protein